MWSGILVRNRSLPCDILARGIHVHVLSSCFWRHDHRVSAALGSWFKTVFDSIAILFCACVYSLGLFAGIVSALADRIRTKKGRLVTNCLFRQGVFVNALALCASDASLNPTKRIQEHSIPKYTNSRPDRSPSNEVYESSDRKYFSLVASPHQSDAASAELADALDCDNSSEAVGAALSSMPLADIKNLMHKVRIPVVVKTDASVSPVHDPRLKTLFEPFARDTAPPVDCPQVG